jgi:hypothetical protein
LQLLLGASVAVSANIELLPIPFQIARLRRVPVTGASQIEDHTIEKLVRGVALKRETHDHVLKAICAHKSKK